MHYFEAGERERSISARYGVSTSAVVNLLRDNAIVVNNRGVTDAEAREMAMEYEAGSSTRELEAKHELSHGAVVRAQHRVGATMRASAPRRKAS